MDESSGFILAAITNIAIFAVIFTLVKFAKKNAYKAISDKYKSEDPMPAGGIRTVKFSYGSNVNFNNAVTILEQSGNLHFKLPFGPHISLPISELTSIQTPKALFNNIYVRLSLRDSQIPEISFVMNKAHTGQFPMLFSKEQATSQVQATPQFQATSQIQATSQVQKNGQPYEDNGPIRAAILIIAIGVGVVLFLMYA